MYIDQHRSAALFLAAVMVLVLPELSFAEARMVPVTGEADGQEKLPKAWAAGEFYSRGKTQSAQADTPPAVSEPAKTQDDKPVSTSPISTSPASSPPAAPAVTPVFPAAVDPKYARELGIMARMRTCADQFNANKANNGNAGMKWIDRTGGYYRACSKRLKG